MTGKTVSSLLMILGAASLAAAGTSAVNFEVPAFRGQPNSGFAGWESFTVPFGGPNFADVSGSSIPGAAITQTVPPDFSNPPGILVSGTGNLYSGFQNMNLILSAGVAQALTNVTIQTRTLGTEWDYGLVLLSYTDGQGLTQSVAPGTMTELFRQAGPPVMGNPTFNVETRFDWDLSGLSDQINSFTVRFTHSGHHLSLDRLELDTLSIPAPGTLAVAPLALVAIRRRRA